MNAAIALVAVLAVGCVAKPVVDEGPAQAELAPMARPTVALNQRTVELDLVKGEEIYYDITEINDDGTHAGLNSSGCSWQSLSEFVAPALMWNDCSDDTEWKSGENKNMQVEGALWPLAVGNKASYSYDQHNALGEMTGRKTRKCTVEGVVNIEVQGEQLDTYKVVCKRVQPGWWQTNVTYFSPQKGRSVKWLQTQKNDGLVHDRELLRIEQL
ncbi:MAG: hypothetical protein AAF404_11290 [Pseudomonadota bacterium]